MGPECTPAKQLELDCSPEKYPPHHGIIRDDVQSQSKRFVADRIFHPHTLSPPAVSAVVEQGIRRS